MWTRLGEGVNLGYLYAWKIVEEYCFFNIPQFMAGTIHNNNDIYHDMK